jgi:hypothetical protein
MKLSSEQFEETVATARECLIDRQNLDYAKPSGAYGLAYEFAEALVQFADACVVGLPCDKHGAVHGQEAEELRAGVEQILKNTSDVVVDAVPDVLHALRKSLIFLLDRIDARDSLGFRDATDPPEESAASRA